ncbi:dnaj subfamily c member 17 [Holotrichia oblita]|uniref:Dnaj subfamily c member 17 n=1 Tax=Holotrichia oblita TaxID=644536 RepID=A0ACB9TUL3_HOLOL|nr:dnaj subfamily c member 17 [Holotrichia oblita]
MNFKIEEEDLYQILEVDHNSSINDIKKAYRKKALKLHPDKNPDNPNAASEFHKLSKVLEILTDESARRAYDKVLKAREEAALRHRQLDSKRRSLKKILRLEEIERLRKEGSKQVEEEILLITKQIHRESEQIKEVWDSSKHRIKIKWKTMKNDPSNGGYTQQLLHKFLSKYGDINVLVVSSKKTGSALVEFNSKRGAEMAVQLEKGLATNPLEMEWLNKPVSSSTPTSSTIKNTDYESLVLMKMRQAEERKRLIQQMMAEDNETN